MNSTSSSFLVNPTSCLHIRTTFDNVPHVKDSIILSCVVNAILGVFATAGNSLVLLTIKKTPTLHTPSNCVLFGLALSDLCVGMFVQPLFVVFKVHELKLSPLQPPENQGNYFNLYCAFGLLADGLGFLLSIVTGFHLAFISLERYLAINLHLRYAELVTNSRIIKGIVGIWLFAASLGLWLFIGQEQDQLKLITFVLAVCFHLILFLIIFCNVKIALILRRHTRAINSQPQTQQVLTVLNMKKFKRSIASMAYVIVLYLLCYVPYGVTMLVKLTRPQSNPRTMLRFVNATFPILFLNSTLNPLVYFWRFRNLRNSALFLMRRSMCGKFLENKVDRENVTRRQRERNANENQSTSRS